MTDMAPPNSPQSHDAARIREKWLSHPVVLVDAPDDGIQEFSWIEATDDITAENAAERFAALLPDQIDDDQGGLRKPCGVTGPFWMVPYDPREDDAILPLDAETDDWYLIERVYWSVVALPADNAVPLWKIEWEPIP